MKIKYFLFTPFRSSDKLTLARKGFRNIKTVFKLLAGFNLLFLFLLSPPARGAKFSRAQGWVNDFAQIIEPETKTKLEVLLSELEEKTQTEVAIVTIPSLEGGNIEQTAVEIFSQWGIGKKGKDNGILILTALKDRKVRIETGYGLEGIIPDGLAGEIIRENILPYFQEGKFSQGLESGASAVSMIIAKNAGIELNSISPITPKPARHGVPIFGLILLFILIPFFIRHPLLFLFFLSGPRGGGFGGGGFGGGSFGGFGGGMSGGGGASGSW